MRIRQARTTLCSNSVLAKHPVDVRPGFVLILVLVVIMMLSFAAYSFSHRMLTEYTASRYATQQIQRRLLAESALELVAVRSEHSRLAKPIPCTLPDGSRGYLEVRRGLTSRGGRPELGLINESSRLNLNALKVDAAHRDETRARLIQLPGMTPSLAEALMDFLANTSPSDSASTHFLEEKDEQPRRTVNRLSDLLHVRGITPELLWGEDQNQNGVLDPEEDDGAARWPADDRDGMLQQGLSQFLTARSAESMFDVQGRPKIVLNQSNLATLFDQVQATFGTTAALFIVAARMNGATYSDALRPDEGDNLEQRRLERFETARARMKAQLGLDDATGMPTETGAGQVRAGLTLTQPAISFRSLVDLFGGHVRILIDGRDTVINSPWPADPATLARQLPLLEEHFTIESDPVPGRININEASEPVLRTIPGITPVQARSICQKQPKPESTSTDYKSIAWLLTHGILTPGEFRQMAPFLTTGGDVYSGLAVGRIDSQVPTAVIQFRIDCTQVSPALLLRKELPPLPID